MKLHSQATSEVAVVDPAKLEYESAVAGPLAVFRAALEPHAKREALRDLSQCKKAFFKDRALNRFLDSALKGPRDDKKVKAQEMPVWIEGEPCWDTSRWELEFRTLYKQLFHSDTNQPEQHRARIKKLRGAALGQSEVCCF